VMSTHHVSDISCHAPTSRSVTDTCGGSNQTFPRPSTTRHAPARIAKMIESVMEQSLVKL